MAYDLPARNDAWRRDLTDPDLFREAALIGGRWIPAEPGASTLVHDPATGEVIGATPELDEAQVQAAIDAAEKAFESWRKTGVKERSRVVRAIGDAMIAAREDLALIMTMEQGKPLAEARGEIDYAAGFAFWFAEECKRTYGETIPSPWPDKRILALKEPIGVVGAITPWNFPSAMITRKALPAIAVGCTVVLKPAEQTPFSAIALGVIAERAGLPPGVFNIVFGDPPAVGQTLCASPVVRKLTFTGSTEVGRILYAQCAPTVKKLGLELGGNAPFIVFDDADLDAAVEGAMASKYRNSGQTCVCANRFLVQDGIHDAFVKRLAEASQQIVVGAGRQAGVTQGPLIDEAGAAKIERLLGQALASGARALVGGGRVSPGGLFFQPTVVEGVTADMALAREEIFGPVAAVFRFKEEAEAIALANSTEYGLAAYFYGRDLGRIWRVMEALDFGIVGVNTGIISNEAAPFGGVKQSGLGREGGRQGMDDFLETKYVCLGGIG